MSADRRAISPDIYGRNFADPALAREIGLPVDRWAGDRAERCNWQAGLARTADDYFFERPRRAQAPGQRALVPGTVARAT